MQLKSCANRYRGLTAIGLVGVLTTSLFGQQVQPGFGVPVQPNGAAGAVNAPQTNLTPINTAPPPSTQPFAAAPPTTGFGALPPGSNMGPPPTSGFGALPPGSNMGPPPGTSSFDPYATNGSSQLGSAPMPANSGFNGAPAPGVTSMGAPTAVPPLGSPGAIPPAPPGGSLFSQMFSGPSYSTAGASGMNAGVYNNPSVYGPPPAFGGTYPGTMYPSQTPSTLFPSGYFGQSAATASTFGATTATSSAFRLCQGPRFRHTYVAGGGGSTGLSTNDTDFSAPFAFPNFLNSAQPLYVVPSFSLHLWDGPANLTADLPSKAYSGFLDVGWFSDPNQMLSTELGVRVGVFTDFDTYNSKSVRVLGKAIASFRWTPASTLKLGVIYLDRNGTKLVPAVGVICQANPYKRYEWYFPQPKFSHYWRTVGTRDFWWYLAGDYGGGSWTIKRTDGSSDSVDINEYRALLGVEWGDCNFIRNGRRTGFFEMGYAFEREIEYRYNPQDDIEPSSSFVVRAGIGY